MIQEAITTNVYVGTAEAVLKTLNTNYQVVDKSTADESKEFYWTDIPFEKQVEKLLTFNKYKKSHYVYGMIYFYQNKPEDTLTDTLKQLPKEVREFRVQRVEIHR
jgi:hypothetical protein